jgi:hypothetical protein
MKQYYDDLKTTYGSSSLKANGNQVVVMVPYQFTNKSAVQEVNNHPWAVAFPSLYASAGSYDGVEFGGPTTVLSTEDDRTRFLLYAEADETAFSALSDGYTAPNIPTSPIKDAKIEIGDYRNDVENDADYQIDEAQYMIKPILNADRWILFSPPFDVTNVYVLEACKELDLENMAKAGNREQAYKQQARATLDLFYYLGYYTVFNQGAEQFWSTYNYWRDNTKNPEARGAVPLKHFTGNNADANYYIQCSTGVWEWDGTKFTTDWKYLPENIEQVNHGGTLYNVVMKQGEVYSIKFPYMYDGYLEANQTNWDYWTGKYLILEGLGKQTIKGKDHHSKLQSAMTASQGSAEVRVNNTLAAMEVGNANAFYLQYNKLDGKNIYSSRFIKSIEVQELYPTEGFVLANNPAAFVPGKKAAIDMMSGVVTYEDDTEDSENGEAKTPTISGGHSLLVYTVETGLGLFPFAPQQVYIYNAAGQLVTSLYLSEETYVALPAGIYLVRGENEQVKAMVK